MKITTLVENLVYKVELVAEHGLSMLIETKNRKILFDTGQSGVLVQNAKLMGIDLNDIDAVVISHGHFDHTGGLKSFLEINSHANIYAKEEIFSMKYYGSDWYVGIPVDTVVPQNRLRLVDRITEMDEGFFIVPDIPLINSADTQFENFFIRKGDEFIPDEFNDELFLASASDGMISVFSSCSHRGITNIISEATRHFGLPLGMVMGGFHLKDADEEQIKLVTTALKQYNPRQLGVCHCSGVGTYAWLKPELSCDVFYNMTGNVVYC
jgi:7,8-dihydropterin-6-yl-methyl-4-(beta-D-ribofuranosyl)aminobenzene 5'-phosphate synthase